MEALINECIELYNDGEITWHDIQDMVGGKLVVDAGGYEAYSKIPIHQRLARENEILEKIERGLRN